MRVPPPPQYLAPPLKEDGGKPTSRSRNSAPKLAPASRAGLLSEIKGGKKLNKTKVDDRSNPAVCGADGPSTNKGAGSVQKSPPPSSGNIGKDRTSQTPQESSTWGPQKRFVTSTGGDIMSDISKEIMKRNRANQSEKPEVPKPLKFSSEDLKNNQSSPPPVPELPEDNCMKLGKDISLSKLSEIATKKRPPSKPPTYKAASTRSFDRNRLPPRPRLSGDIGGLNKPTVAALDARRETSELSGGPPLAASKNRILNRSATSILMRSDSNSSSLDLGSSASRKEHKSGFHNSSEKDDIIYFYRWHFRNDLPVPRSINKKA